MNPKTFFLSIGTLFFLLTCFNKKNTSTVTYDLNDEIRNFSLSITWNDGVASVSESDKSKISSYLKNAFSSQNFETVDFESVLLYVNDEETLFEEKEVVTLVGVGNSNIPIAVTFTSNEVRAIGDGGKLGASTLHSCSGSPCSCCDFIKTTYEYVVGSYSKIEGCKCKQSPDDCRTTNGRCNHSISNSNN